MALVIENDLTSGLSGRFGNKFIFKQLRGKTIVARRGKPTTKQSALQRDNRLRFRMATKFAQAMMLDADRKAYYWKMAKEMNLPNAYTAAITEYMRKPQLKEAEVSTDQSLVTVRVKADKKDFDNKAIRVHALGKNGEVLETKETTATRDEWTYTFSVFREMMDKVVIEVIDYAGNVVRKKIGMELELDD
ncbi:hypothetical protein [Chryseosolibacter indicus]|uniref:Uncharacterized protein n=1 Tax=Chryseosolibacter indicus TaxID=2782351 RepID=A0ABS5VNF7_9BACT|nr:hypothetical protein [Chryseosolibacter indicus]MBT1702987.1 hypothetical protein [Chryseosolibacter indicus]